jgi:hypothetical protein
MLVAFPMDGEKRALKAASGLLDPVMASFQFRQKFNAERDSPT